MWYAKREVYVLILSIVRVKIKRMSSGVGSERPQGRRVGHVVLQNIEMRSGPRRNSMYPTYLANEALAIQSTQLLDIFSLCDFVRYSHDQCPTRPS